MNEWNSPARFLLLIVLIFGLGLIVSAARAIIAPLVIACLLAYVLNPAVSRVKKHTKLDHKKSVLIVYGLFLLGLVTLMVVFTPAIVQQARDLSQQIQNILPEIENLLEKPVKILGYDLQLLDFYEEIESTVAQFFKPERVFRVVINATTNLVWVLVILVTMYYLLLDWEQLREWLIGLAPKAYQEDIRRFHGEIKLVWSVYLRGQLYLMFIMGMSTALAATLIGLPNAALIGIVAGILDFVPSLGPAIAMIIAGMVAWLNGSLYIAISNEWFVVMVVGVFSLLQLIENVWLQPRIIGHRLNLHRGIVFVAVIGTLTLGSAPFSNYRCADDRHGQGRWWFHS